MRRDIDDGGEGRLARRDRIPRKEDALLDRRRFLGAVTLPAVAAAAVLRICTATEKIDRFGDAMERVIRKGLPTV